jgi:hypothetical protein
MVADNVSGRPCPAASNMSVMHFRVAGSFEKIGRQPTNNISTSCLPRLRFRREYFTLQGSKGRQIPHVGMQ